MSIQEFQKQHLLDISTAHIPKHTADALGNEQGFRTAALYDHLSYTPWSDYGWIIWSGAESAEIDTHHPELASVLAFAQAKGFSYVKLDCDADVLPDLPTFEW